VAYKDSERAREYQREWARKRRADPAERERINRYKRERLANNPELHEREKQRKRESARERYANDPDLRERQKRHQRERWANDPDLRDRQLRRNRERLATDPDFREATRQQGKRWRDANGERFNQDRRERYANDPDHRERVRQSAQERYANDPDLREAARQRVKAWNAANPEKMAKRRNDWAAANPEKVRAHGRKRAQTRRARKVNAATIPFTEQQWRAKVAYWGDQCWMCGGEWSEMDHVKPRLAARTRCATCVRSAGPATPPKARSGRCRVFSARNRPRPAPPSLVRIGDRAAPALHGGGPFTPSGRPAIPAACRVTSAQPGAVHRHRSIHERLNMAHVPLKTRLV
jgi:hypothetical protein